MARKPLTQLRGRVRDGQAELSFYKSTPAFADPARREAWELRIDRLSLPDFEFNNDYAEFFDGLSRDDADTIFRGSLPAVNDRKFVFRDADVSSGSTYAYWVTAAHAPRPVGPLPLRVRDPRVWWPYAETRRRLEALARAYPDRVRVTSCGQSVRRRDIMVASVGNMARVAGFVGVVHAGESGPELLIPALERLLAERPELLASAGLAVLPVLNVDEREREVEGTPWYLRTNANGVDLNRNFDADWDRTEYGYGLDSSEPDSVTYRGPAPASEPETRAAAAFLGQTAPEVVFSCHCLASICGDSFLVSRSAEQDRAYAAAARGWAASYRRGMYPAEPCPEKLLSFRCSAGSLAHWLFTHWRVPGFDLELGTHDDARACITDSTTPALLSAYQDRHFGGIVAVLERLAASPDGAS